MDEDNSGIDEETIKERSEPNPTNKNKGLLVLILLVGILIGVLIMFIIYQNQSKETEPNEAINEEKLVNVDITTQITDVVENVTPAVVGITNVQKRPEDFWREDQSFENEAGTGSRSEERRVGKEGR